MRKNQENGKKMSKICSFAHCEKNRDPPLKAQGVNLVRACESLLRAYEVLCCGSAQYIEYTQFTPKTLAFAFPESVRPVVGSICRNGQVLVFGQFPHTVYTVYTGGVFRGIEKYKFSFQFTTLHNSSQLFTTLHKFSQKRVCEEL